MRYHKLTILLVVFLGLSCSKEGKVENQIKKIPVNFEVYNFSKTFSEAETVDDIIELQEIFPNILDSSSSPIFWLEMAQDSMYRSLQIDIDQSLGTFNLDEELTSLLQHQSYYFKNLPETTAVYLMIGNGEPDLRVLVDWNSMAICMDFYLGAENSNYDRFASYQREQFDSKFLMRDIAIWMNQERFSRQAARTFVEKMIRSAKKYYVATQLVPSVRNRKGLSYSDQQIAWAEANEFAVWSYFLENDLLFQSDTDLERRFINPAPFSKFYLDIDRESPGMIGVYIGYQIIEAYMRKKDVSLQELLKTPNMEIFQNANFKPRKA